MNRIYSALILDDDPAACAYMKWHLEEHFPFLRAVECEEAKSVRGFDVYFIDNEFDGKMCAVDLVETLRETEHDALILVFSAHLSPDTYKRLINVGCNGALEKGKPTELAGLSRLVKKYLDQRQADAERSRSRGLKGVLSEITDLMTQWNRRLDAHETQAKASR